MRLTIFNVGLTTAFLPVFLWFMGAGKMVETGNMTLKSNQTENSRSDVLMVPEIIVDEKGNYFISSVDYPNLGVSLFPFKEGVAAIMVHDGNEHYTINYAKEWISFEIASVCELVPIAPGPFIPDAFTNTSDGRGITWGLSHFTTAGKRGVNQHSILARFDCDLSQDVHDPNMKRTVTWHDLDVFFAQGLSKEQRERIEKANIELQK